MTPIERGYAITGLVTAHIRATAAEQGVSLRELSERIGMPYVTLQRRLRRHTWKLPELARVADVLGFDLVETYRVATETVDAGQVNPSVRELAAYVNTHGGGFAEAAHALGYWPTGAPMP